MPTNMQSSLIFHYNLKFYDSDGDSYDGVSLKRFVMQVKFMFISYLSNFSYYSILTMQTCILYIKLKK